MTSTKFHNKGEKTMKKFEAITDQQETALAEYNSEEQFITFLYFYRAWCLENGYYNDLTSYQYEQLGEGEG
jgi:hypothetical protein